LPLDLVQDHINDDEGACAANTSRAVHKHWASICDRLLSCIHIVQEVQYTSRIWWHTMIWPRLEQHHIHKCFVNILCSHTLYM
jgi:hypothetical protein